MAKYRNEIEQQAYEDRMKLLNQKLRKAGDLSGTTTLGSCMASGYELDELSLKILDAISEPWAQSR